MVVTVIIVRVILRVVVVMIVGLIVHVIVIQDIVHVMERLQALVDVIVTIHIYVM